MNDYYSNKKWFNSLSIEDLYAINSTVGLECQEGNEPNDLSNLYPILNKYNSKNILEVSGGYGRVVDGLLRNKIGETIYAIEPITNYADHLSSKYASNKNITVETVDLFAFACLPVFDTVLLMGPSLTQFSMEEQLVVFIKVKSLLRSGGMFTIDTRVTSGDKEIVLPNALNEYSNFIPTHENIMSYAEMTRMELKEKSDYLTKDITRSTYTFQKV